MVLSGKGFCRFGNLPHAEMCIKLHVFFVVCLATVFQAPQPLSFLSPPPPLPYIQAARAQVAAVLEASLLTGEEELHWIAPTTAKPRPHSDGLNAVKDENLRCCLDGAQNAGKKRRRTDGDNCCTVEASDNPAAGKVLTAVDSRGVVGAGGSDRGGPSSHLMRARGHQEKNGVAQPVEVGVQKVASGVKVEIGGGVVGENNIPSAARVEGENAGALDGSRRKSKRIRRPKVPYIGL